MEINEPPRIKMSSFEDVDELLSRFDEITELVKLKRKKVDRFLNKLGDQLEDFYLKKKILRNGVFKIVGSASEETAVRDDVDFDVILELPEPFTMDYLTVQNVGKNGIIGVYKLKNIDDDNNESSYEYENPYEYDSSEDYESNSSCSNSVALDSFMNENGFLKVTQLKEAIFVELENAIQQIAKEETDVKYELKRKKSSFGISVQSLSSSSFKIDLVPQIKASQQDLNNDWNDDVSYVVKEYLDDPNHSEHAHFNLSFPFWHDIENYAHLAVYATFSQLEGHCMRASDNVRNAVRLTNAFSQYCGWADKGLKSFHIKRIAISLFDTLKEMDPWFGYQAILTELRTQLKDDVIWGVFLFNHDIALEDKKTCQQLSEKIFFAKQKICPSNILKKLSLYF